MSPSYTLVYFSVFSMLVLILPPPDAHKRRHDYLGRWVSFLRDIGHWERGTQLIYICDRPIYSHAFPWVLANTCVLTSMHQDWHTVSSNEKGVNEVDGWDKCDVALLEKNQQQITKYFKWSSSLENHIGLCKWENMHFLKLKQLLKYRLDHESYRLLQSFTLWSSTR